MATITDKSIWIFDGSRATLSTPLIAGVVDVANPGGGLHDLKLAGAPIGGWIHGVDLDSEGRVWQAAEAFVRGSDLIVVYRTADEQPLVVRVYWRVVSADERGTVFDLIVSLETRAWESYPQTAVGSQLPGECLTVDDAAAALWRLSPEWSYAEAPRPGDFAAARIDAAPSNACRTSWPFDGVFMERGVIRRLHHRGVILHRAGDVEAAQAIGPRLDAEPPVLTA